MKYEVTTQSVHETHCIAQRLAKLLPFGGVVVLEGRIGSGKTTFTQGFGKALGIQRTIKSPTYTIVKNYELKGGEFFHVDAYRLEEGGADTIDLESYIHKESIVFIEWAQFVEGYLPENYLRVTLEPQEDMKRIVTIQSVGTYEPYLKVIEQLIVREKEEN